MNQNKIILAAMLCTVASAYAQRDGATKISSDKPTQQATLVVQTDSTCELSINSKQESLLKAGETASIQVNAGQIEVDCVSTEDSSLRSSVTRKAVAGEKTTVNVGLASALLSRMSAKALTRRYTDSGSGVIRDSVTFLEWSQSDNGADLNWNAAMSYCKNKGGDWRLGTVDELKSLYDRTFTFKTPCSSYTCGVSPNFRLTSAMFWSSDRVGASDGAAGARVVSLISGDTLSTRVENEFRALCVRLS